jgi:hypothetical protein
MGLPTSHEVQIDPAARNKLLLIRLGLPTSYDEVQIDPAATDPAATNKLHFLLG